MWALKEQTLMKSGSKSMNRCLWGYSSESCLACANDRLCAVSHLQLAEDIRDIVTYGLHTDDQHLRNLGVLASLCYQHQHLALALGQFGKKLRRRGGPGRGKEVEQPLGNRRAKDRFA